MADIFRQKANPEKRLPSADILLEYTRVYNRIVRDYKEEIQLINSMLEKLRQERETFYLEKIHQIRESMETDEVSPEIREQWLIRLTDNMEQSFRMSELLIGQYATDNIEEFQAKVQAAIDRAEKEFYDKRKK